MSFQPGANLYTQGFGSRPENVEVPHIDVRAPASSDTNYPIGKLWINNGVASYQLIGLSSFNGATTATWAALGSAGGDIFTLTGDSGTATPSSGNIQIAGTSNQISTSASGAVVTLALAGPYTPATYTAHGVLLGEGTSSIAATAVGATGQALMGSTGADPVWTDSPSFSGSVTAGTGLTVTTGGVTITAGDETLTAGNVIINGAAKQLRVHGGAVTDFIGQATLTNGTVTVANTNIAATDRVYVTRSAKNGSTAYGTPLITITASTNFVLTACKSDTTTETGDASTFDYFIVRQV